MRKIIFPVVFSTAILLCFIADETFATEIRRDSKKLLSNANIQLQRPHHYFHHRVRGHEYVEPTNGRLEDLNYQQPISESVDASSHQHGADCGHHSHDYAQRKGYSHVHQGHSYGYGHDDGPQRIKSYPSYQEVRVPLAPLYQRTTIEPSQASLRTSNKDLPSENSADYYSACPSGHSGVLPYSEDCASFLNCWKGRGTVQKCGPGTVFNPKILQCDRPDKVECYPPSETDSERKTFSSVRTNRPREQVALARQIQPREEPLCPAGVTGLQPHPSDCSKFVNCANGQAYVQQCGPGTAFCPKRKVCDFINKVDCGQRPFGETVRREHTVNVGVRPQTRPVPGSQPNVVQEGGNRWTAMNMPRPDPRDYRPTYGLGSNGYVGTGVYVEPNQPRTTVVYDKGSVYPDQFYHKTTSIPLAPMNNTWSIKTITTVSEPRIFETQPVESDEDQHSHVHGTNPTHLYPFAINPNPQPRVNHSRDLGFNAIPETKGTPIVRHEDSPASYYPARAYPETRVDAVAVPSIKILPPFPGDSGQRPLPEDSFRPVTRINLDTLPQSAVFELDQYPAASNNDEIFRVATRPMETYPIINDASNLYGGLLPPPPPPPTSADPVSSPPTAANEETTTSDFLAAPTESTTPLSNVRTFQIYPPVKNISEPSYYGEPQYSSPYSGVAHSRDLEPKPNEQDSYFPSNSGVQEVEETFTATKTSRQGSNPPPYNKQYYKPVESVATPNADDEQPLLDTQLPISEALKILLKPYLNRSGLVSEDEAQQAESHIMSLLPKTSNLDETTTLKPETKPLENSYYIKEGDVELILSGEQSSLVTPVKGKPVDSQPSPQPDIHKRFDISCNEDSEEFYRQNPHLPNPCEKQPNESEEARVYPIDPTPPHSHQRRDHKISESRSQDGPCKDHSDEFHRRHPHLKNPCTNETAPSEASAAQSYRHPHHAHHHHFHHPPPSRHHSPPKFNHYHHHHHHNHKPSHSGPCNGHSEEFHRNHPNMPNPCQNKTNDSPIPKPVETQPSGDFSVEIIKDSAKPNPTKEDPDIDIRFSRSTPATPAVCDFNCKNTKCIKDFQVCDGVNDCGDRSDEIDCNHLGYEVRLKDGEVPHAGRIEVKISGRWGAVCDTNFGLRDADVVCKELGFQLGAKEVRGNSFYGPAKGSNLTFVMDEVKCQGNEKSLKECDFKGWGVADCGKDEMAGVICKVPLLKCPKNYWGCKTTKDCLPTAFVCDNTPDCEDGSDEDPAMCNAPVKYRLEGGRYANEGRLEVLYRGQWGTVCDDDFNLKAAQVACNSMGFYGAPTIEQNIFGQGNGPIWLDDVACYGNETSIDECSHLGWGVSNCNHTEDVSLTCKAGPPPRKEPTTRLALQPWSKEDELNQFSDEVDLEELFNQTSDWERSSKVLHPPRRCGHFNPKVLESTDHPEQERVLDGTVAKRGRHPWQATIRLKGRGGISSHWCGAVLISKRHLLTAAHCLVGYQKGAYFVRLGDHYSNVVENQEIDTFIQSWYIHEKFRDKTHMNNDIALVVLKNPVRFNDYIQPICLPDKGTPLDPDRLCTISGWGSIKSGSSTPSNILRAAEVPILSDDVCKQPYVYGNAMTENMFCAGHMDENVDACDGDSGGPLVCSDADGETLYGIISWGQHCGFPNKPGVYVRVEKYIDWIYEKINQSMKH